MHDFREWRQYLLTNAKLIAACRPAILYVSGSRFCCADEGESALLGAGVTDANAETHTDVAQKGCSLVSRLAAACASSLIGLLLSRPVHGCGPVNIGYIGELAR